VFGSQEAIRLSNEEIRRIRSAWIVAIAALAAIMLATALWAWNAQRVQNRTLMIWSSDRQLQAELVGGEGHLQARIDGVQERVLISMERQSNAGPVVYVFTVLADGAVLKQGTRIAAFALEREGGALLLCGDSCESLGLPTLWQAQSHGRAAAEIQRGLRDTPLNPSAPQE
jgi:hypothetical protein